MAQFKQKINQYLETVLESGGSDLHLNSEKPPMVRIDSLLHPIKNEAPLTQAVVQGLVFSLLSSKQEAYLKKTKEIDFSYQFQHKARFRVNVFYQQGQVSAALRLIPHHVQTIEELGLPEEIVDFANRNQGFVLCVGPAGHGKTTTLASMVDYINYQRQDHIVTIEDPIEYVFSQRKSLIAQREVSTDTDSFAQALRSALRQDPDVVLVGEMRDLETISTALTLAETGHLVMSTLHTNDAAQTIDRIIDVFPAHQQAQVRTQIANTLIGIISQRLIPRIGGGRVPAVEILKMTPAAQNLIRENKTYQINSIIQTGAKEGMVPLNRSLLELVQAGEITEDDALFYSNNEDDLRSKL